MQHEARIAADRNEAVVVIRILDGTGPATARHLQAEPFVRRPVAVAVDDRIVGVTVERQQQMPHRPLAHLGLEPGLRLVGRLGDGLYKIDLER